MRFFYIVFLFLYCIKIKITIQNQWKPLLSKLKLCIQPYVTRCMGVHPLSRIYGHASFTYTTVPQFNLTNSCIKHQNDYFTFNHSTLQLCTIVHDSKFTYTSQSTWGKTKNILGHTYWCYIDHLNSYPKPWIRGLGLVLISKMDNFICNIHFRWPNSIFNIQGSRHIPNLF